MLTGFASLAAGGVGLAGYAFAIEPAWRLVVTRYRVTPPGWPPGFHLRAAVIADLHACDPFMSVARIARIVARTNALGADIILLLGDYVAGHRYVTKPVRSGEWAEALSHLEAPLGVHAILGNHDWWDDRAAQRRGHGPIIAGRALEKAGIAVYHNDVARLAKGSERFWIAGLGDQLALVRGWRSGQGRYEGVDDLEGTLAKVTGDAPILLLAHEPDIFPRVPHRVALTLSGHTHGGQVRLLGYAPIVPSRYGNRYAYGHVVEGGRHLVVSGGLGCSILPVRFGCPPEIVLVEIGAP